jgi:hypothetical protein
MLFAFGTFRAIMQVEAQLQSKSKSRGHEDEQRAFRPGVPGGANSCPRSRVFFLNRLRPLSLDPPVPTGICFTPDWWYSLLRKRCARNESGPRR